MPNIHFFGFPEQSYRIIKPRVNEVLKGIGLDTEAITTFHPGSVAESCDGKGTCMPYVHIFSSNEEHITEIINAFVENEMFFDIESSTGDFVETGEIRRRNGKMKE